MIRPTRTCALREAALADPLSAEPWNQLATVAFARWQQEQDPDRLQQFREYSHTALELDPDANSAWIVSGDRYLEAYARNRVGTADLEDFGGRLPPGGRALPEQRDLPRSLPRPSKRRATSRASGARPTPLWNWTARTRTRTSGSRPNCAAG